MSLKCSFIQYTQSVFTLYINENVIKQVGTLITG